MQKKILLAATPVLMAIGAYLLFSSNDQLTETTSDGQGIEAVREFVSVPTTQGAQSFGDVRVPISPGEESRFVVLDEVSGRPKYAFEARKWFPQNDSEYHVEQMLITIFMPRGEMTYISADQADVTVAQKTKSHVDAQRGVLRGNVRVIIDRTTTAWRQENPDRAEMNQHPDELIRIEMDSARFDMDRAELLSDSTVVVDGREARIEDVSGLTVKWNQTDNRVELLHLEQGGRMTLRRGANLVEFGLPGEERKRRRGDAEESKSVLLNEESEGAEGAAVAATHGQAAIGATGAANTDERVPLARANEPISVKAMSADEAASEIRLEGARFMANVAQSIYDDDDSRGLREPDALAADLEAIKSESRGGMADPLVKESDVRRNVSSDSTGSVLSPKGAKRINTYRVVFNHQVAVEQFRAGVAVGRMDAERLEVHFDLGGQQRDLMSPERGDGAIKANRPAGVEPSFQRDAMGTASINSGPAGETPAVASREDVAAARADAAEADAGEDVIVLTWNGPLELRPLFVPPGEQSGNRFDAIASGEPVVVTSERGSADCLQLVYRGERKQIWLLGASEAPVVMSVDADRRLSGTEVFFDRRRGLGRVEGAGFMVDRQTGASKLPRKAGESGPVALVSVKEDAPGDRLSKPGEPVEIRWSRGVDLELGVRSVERVNEQTGRSELRDKEFLRRAWFHGDVRFSRGDEHLESEEVAATFGATPASSDGADTSDAIEHLNMSGQVRLSRGDDRIEAERLDVRMARGPDGRSAPRAVDAVGEVLAKQGEREIRANVMKVTLNQFADKTVMAPDGKTPIVGKARLGIEMLDATGRVSAVDPAHNMRIRDAESLKAAIRNGEEMVRVSIVSPSPEIFAKARFGDMAIHGHQIEIDADKQSVDVPGSGKAWMVTYEDFGGRRLAKPTPVKTTWTGQMQLRLAKDYGVFVDNVRSSTDEFTLNCDKLTIRLAKAPAKEKKPKGRNYLDQLAFLGEIRNDRAELEFKDNITVKLDQKRPVYVVAEGHAEAISSTFGPPTADFPRGRLMSRARIAGRQIVADLRTEQMSVPCEGTLLIEDYQFEDASGKVQRRRSSHVASPMMSSVRSDGPSQTLIEWGNAMDFFVDRALVSFDKNVRMLHLSGQQVVMRDELAEAFDLNAAALQKLGEGRRAELTCGNLLLEFASGKASQASSDPAGSSQFVRATELERMIARDAVHMQDGTKSLMGEYLQYLRATGEVRLEGGPGLDARIIDQAEGGRFNMWRGPLLIWNRVTNAIQSPRSSVTSSGR
ncbi:MAG: hypothetical protein KF841_04090 [Phycisphaerae bacterium]|nr:hypothetical protein [Phycisphaerae bacterium]